MKTIVFLVALAAVGASVVATRGGGAQQSPGRRDADSLATADEIAALK